MDRLVCIVPLVSFAALDFSGLLLQVEFLHGVDFISNEARGSADDAADVAGGGAVAVGPEGSVEFQGDAEFTDNKAQSGASGGALANLGSVSFYDYADFFANTAQGGGDGGAIANFGSLFFGRRSSFIQNVAAGTICKRSNESAIRPAYMYVVR